MFGSVGIPELIMIFVVALLLFGPKKLPEIGRSLGKALGEFKRATNDLQRSLEEEVAADELKQAKRDLETAIKPDTGAPQGQATPTAVPPSATTETGSAPVSSEPQPQATEPK